MTAHWEKQARQWVSIGYPLRPSPIDIQNHHLWLNDKVKSKRNALSVLLLGSTPEIANMSWPCDTTFIAVDMNLTMLQSILPTQTPTVKPIALAGNWQQLPLLTSSIDIVVGDGCYSSLAEIDYLEMTREIKRVLKLNGIFIMRFFTRPEKRESIDSLLHDLLSGKIDNFHVFKFRLAMALHGTLQQGVALNSIWDCWNDLFKKVIQIPKKQFQWSDEIVDTINSYKNANVFYTFPTLQEVRMVISHHFNEEEIFIPDYTFGLRCPSLKLKPLSF
jgi:ubiquinone/menaquinone biosynthesis C-methylase UbiE